MGTRRRILLAAAWLATAVLAGLVAAWLLRVERERIVLLPGPAAVPAPSYPPAPPPPGRTPAPRGKDVGHPAAAPAATAAAPPAEDPCFPTIEVAVIPSEGQPLGGGILYALEPGAPGAREEDDLPHADLGNDLAGILRLPHAGTWDIGFSSTLGAGLLPDVRVEAGPPQRLVLRMAGDLRVRARCDPPLPASVRNAEVQVFLNADDAEPWLWYPGRGERGPASASFLLGPDGTGESPPLPSGRRFTVGANLLERRLHVESADPADRDREAQLPSLVRTLEPRPDRVRPGETVTLRVRTRTVLVVHPEVPREFGGLPFLPVSYRLRQEERETRGTWTFLPEAQTQGKRYVFVLPVEPGPASLSWSGDNVKPGSVDELRIEEGGVREVPLPLVLLSPEEARPPPPEAAASAAPAPAQPPVPVEFRGIPAGSVGDVEVLGVTVPAGDGEEVTFQECLAPKGASLEADWRRVRSAVAVLGPDLASDPVPVPDSGAAVFALRPAGLLLAAPDRILPGGMGRLTLRLPGGRPIPVHRDGGTDFTGSVVEVEPGMLLGPLPEGEWRFEVRLGRVRLPDAVAAARAGRIDVLRIPTRGE